MWHFNRCRKNLNPYDAIILEGLSTERLQQRYDNAREVAEDLGVESVLVQKRRGYLASSNLAIWLRIKRKKRIFGYELKDQCTKASEESASQFKTNFFLQLVDRVIASLKDGFEQMHSVVEILNFLFSQESL